MVGGLCCFRANFNASEKGQTSARYFADHFAPVRETPQDITSPPLPLPRPLSLTIPFITSHRLDPIRPLVPCTESFPFGSSNPKLQGASRLSSGTKVSAGARSCCAENGGHLHAAFVLPSYFRVRSVAHESQRLVSRHCIILPED